MFGRAKKKGMVSKWDFTEAAEKLRAKKDRKYAYVKFDIVNFRSINEMFTHEQGDFVLKTVEKNVQNFIQKEEIAARDDSDVFNMLLKYENSDELRERVHTFLKSHENIAMEESGIIYHVTFACGICLLEEGTSVVQASGYADIARRANTCKISTEIMIFDKALHDKHLLEKELESDMKNALKNDEFEVYFQPKYDISTEKIIGAEALIRWNHPKRGILLPGSFISLFENNGFITKIDFYVLETVCKYLKRTIEKGINPVRISVNLSRFHLGNPKLVEELKSTVDKYGVPRKYIEIEITETMIYNDMQAMVSVMTDIKEAGFALAMDDFGTGYSSLNLLSKMPIDVLKLDKTFIKECENTDAIKDRSVISHIISMAKDLNMEVIAEGVENEKQKDFLKESNCDTIQGYYYSRPMPIKDFEAVFEA